MTDWTANLNLAMVGNSRIAALIDPEADADIVWMCVPRFDGDPVFCRLLDANHEAGRFAIEIERRATVESEYVRNTPVLRTVVTDTQGGQVEILDFAPRFEQFGRVFAPVGLVRIVRRLAGRPRIRVLFRPRCRWGAEQPQMAFGTHHLRAEISAYPLRLTTDAPITQIVEQRTFLVENSYTFVLGPDETLSDDPRQIGQRFLDQTLRYWQLWVRKLALPFEWQDEVIRAAITLKLNAFDDTGAIIAAVTTSIPEASGSQRNWDYRYCWLRDAYFVVNALNRLGATTSMERFLHYIENIVADTGGAPLQPVYALNGEARLTESVAEHLAGYREMAPVRIGNLAYLQTQNDVYGSAILGVAHAFFDRRMLRPADQTLFEQLEPLGERAYALHGQPDAGIWEYRERQSVHTFSSLMCWAACDRLARIASRLGLAERHAYWAARATEIHHTIYARAWNDSVGSFTAAFGGTALDASLLLMGELGFLAPTDVRLRATVETIGRQLRRGDFLLRYDEPDDFGAPETAFAACTFWWVLALAHLGERDRAREMFEQLLARRNRFGLLSEDIDPRSGQLWGNFPQTYSMAGIVTCAMRLSMRWDEAF